MGKEQKNGQEPWDGSIHLHEMLEIPEGMKDQKFLQEYLPDYRINLIDAGKVEHIESFQTDLQILFNMLKCKNQKEELQK